MLKKDSQEKQTCKQKTNTIIMQYKLLIGAFYYQVWNVNKWNMQICWWKEMQFGSKMTFTFHVTHIPSQTACNHWNCKGNQQQFNMNANLNYFHYLLLQNYHHHNMNHSIQIIVFFIPTSFMNTIIQQYSIETFHRSCTMTEAWIFQLSNKLPNDLVMIH